MRIKALSVFVVGSVAAFAACSGGPSGSTFLNGGPSGGNSNGGSSSSSGGSINLGGNNGTGGGSTLSPDAACASSKQTALGIPVDIYAMIDISGSMVDHNSPKWANVKSALTNFVNDPANTGIGIGLQYFPGSPECSISTYSTPSVSIAPLLGNAQAVINSLNAQSPNGYTPTLPALTGAIQYARTWKNSHPTHAVVVVLATDGEPNHCNSTVQAVKTEAQNGYTGSPSITTYVIGVGLNTTDEATMNSWAAAGGSTKAYFVDGGNASQFSAAMDAIRGAATLPCTYQMPTPPQGQTLDPNKVNVAFLSSSQQTTNLLQVSGAGKCTSSGGWYYTTSNGQQVIKLCPATCSTVTADSKGQVKILLGCQTNVVPPH